MATKKEEVLEAMKTDGINTSADIIELTGFN